MNFAFLGDIVEVHSNGEEIDDLNIESFSCSAQQ